MYGTLYFTKSELRMKYLTRGKNQYEELRLLQWVSVFIFPSRPEMDRHHTFLYLFCRYFQWLTIIWIRTFLYDPSRSLHKMRTLEVWMEQWVKLYLALDVSLAVECIQRPQSFLKGQTQWEIEEMRQKGRCSHIIHMFQWQKQLLNIWWNESRYSKAHAEKSCQPIKQTSSTMHSNPSLFIAAVCSSRKWRSLSLMRPTHGPLMEPLMKTACKNFKSSHKKRQAPVLESNHSTTLLSSYTYCTFL